MKRKVWNITFNALMHIFSAITVILLIFLFGYILMRGIPHLSWRLVSTESSYLNNSIGILPNILNTLYLIFIAMLIALPLSVGAAIYLNEYAKSGKIIDLIELATEVLSGIPSIIFGLVGMLLFTQLGGLKQGTLAGGLTLVMMVIPSMIRTTQESLKSVPDDYRTGSLALGSGKWYMIRTVVLPSAMDGIVTGSILAIGRIVGESAALLFTAGFGLALNGFISSLQSSSASLTVALYIFASERGETDVAFAIAVILIIITLLINFFADFAGKRLKAR